MGEQRNMYPSPSLNPSDHPFSIPATFKGKRSGWKMDRGEWRTGGGGNVKGKWKVSGWYVEARIAVEGNGTSEEMFKGDEMGVEDMRREMESMRR